MTSVSTVPAVPTDGGVCGVSAMAKKSKWW